MPLNPTESYEDLSKYHQFYCSFHSAYELSEQNFLKVPPKTIIVSTYYDNETTSYDHPQINRDLFSKKDYLIHALLTKNEHIPEYHKFHNKTIYMPGSCIPNIALEFMNKEGDEMMTMGIFDIDKIYHNPDLVEGYEYLFRDDFKNAFVRKSIVPEHLANNKNLTLLDLIRIIRLYSNYEYYIIFIDGCAGINYGNRLLQRNKMISTTDKNKIGKDTIEKNKIKLSSAYTENNRDCVLDSLQKFTSKYSFYNNKKKLPIDFSKHYPEYNKNIEPEDIYIKKYKKDLKDVKRYFSNLSDVDENEEEEKDIYYIDPDKNKVSESVGSLGPLSSNVMSISGSGKNKENLFNKYFQKEVTQILSPERTRKKPSRSQTARKIQPLRRSSRIAASRKMYDGKRRRSSKLKSRVITLQKSTSPDKKYMARIDNKTVHFGAKGYSDFTKHRDMSRKKRYISRHRSRENWTKSGIKTAGFWSKQVLWNKPSFTGSIKDTEKRFGIRIRYKNQE